ncbi:MAG: DUF3307 domain-containing protein [candidate division Zixibacteria bacterium]|nr:DUF3307 domain-containing protein [candidate division Zixibacteria bacterium]
MDILFFLILGHFCGDYAFQSDRMAERKKSSLIILSYHVIVYTICIGAFFVFYSLLYYPGLFYQTATLLFLGILYIEHWVQDFIKNRNETCSKQNYYIDQMIHIAVLYFYRIFIYSG